MEWNDNGVVLRVRPYGDSNIILSLFTCNHGLHNGIIQLSKKRQTLQIGDRIHVTWRARLAENLGKFSNYDILSSPFYSYFQDRSKLLCLSSIASTLCKALPENCPHTSLYYYFLEFADTAENNQRWYTQYLKLELEVLSQLGFALDLSKCAVLNSTKNLLFISPKTGKAVSSTATAITHAS